MSLKVMLVDDEPFILQGLTMLISWEEENCRIVKTAANGMEAYEYLKENQVDLVLTDVEMPVMDGLTLLEKVRREKISDACFAILSGYNDFSYAQKAIAFSCVEYLLKPVSGEALLKLIKRVDEKKEKADYENAVKKDLKRSYLIQSIAALLQGKAEPETISYIRENLSFSGRLRYVQISPDGVSFLEELSDKERKELRNRIYENVCAFLAEDAACCIRDFPGLSEEYEVTLLYDEAFSKKRGMTTERFLEKLLAAAGKGLETEIVLTVGKAVEDPEKLSHSYSSACVLKSSQGFRELTTKNVELNFPGDKRHEAFCEDAFKYLDKAGGDYDLVILDPPAFAKHRGALHNALKGYTRLNMKAFEKIRPGGILFTFSCSQVVTKDNFRNAVFTAAALAHRNVRILHQLHQPADHPINIFHPEGEYLKGLVLYVE